MTTFHLDTVKLMRELDQARADRAPTDDCPACQGQDDAAEHIHFPISYRQVAAEIGVGSSSVFNRIQAGRAPDADALCALIMWLNPEAKLADYVLPGPGRRRARLRGTPETATLVS